MRSALKIIAFAQGNRAEGIRALLETALEAMDDAKFRSAAMYVDRAVDELPDKIANAPNESLLCQSAIKSSYLNN